jgi:hypothetical protein
MMTVQAGDRSSVGSTTRVKLKIPDRKSKPFDFANAKEFVYERTQAVWESAHV